MTIKFYARTKQGYIVTPNYEVMRFPGGEWHIKNHDTADYTEQYAVVNGADVNDLVIAGLWANMVFNTTPTKPRHLFLPYLPAARADRDLPLGVRVYRALIDGMDFTSVTYIDPHSDVADEIYSRENGWIDDLTGHELDAAHVAVRAVAGRSGLSPYIGVIAPDKGAHRRARSVGDKLGVPTFFASKERNFETGKLRGFVPPDEWDYRIADWVYGAPGTLPRVPESSSETGIESKPPVEGRYLVVDDICDGGGTFMGLASVLGIPRENLDLWVTHGIFSGNAAQLNEAYGNIYTTDSHPGARNEAVGAKVTPLLGYFLAEISNKED